MAKKAKFGVSTAPRDKPKKRPGRHKKSRNKHEKRQQKNQKKGWQISYKILDYPCNSNHPIMEDLNYILSTTNKE